MDWSAALANLQNPPILFFLLGLLAPLLRSQIEIPAPVTKLIALYLLWAIGFKGGVELARGGVSLDVAATLLVAIGFAALSPLWVFAIARRRFTVDDATALAATYGSVSAVTFLTACALLDRQGIAYGGHMVAAMALMESPAIVVAVLLRRRLLARQGVAADVRLGPLLHDALLNGPVLLLLGSLAIGALTGERGYATMRPLCTDLFQGVLVFFLLDLGVMAGGRITQLRSNWKFLVPFAVLLPAVHAVLGLLLARALGLGVGDGMLLATLTASASYIAVPAAMRLSVPAAEPSVYVAAALGVTFPWNIVFGLPLMQALANLLLAP
ncbi:MAG: sodium-dependent bicarbonate transport family permease [Planctomycetes bacterium]|nr:sodium-dependent bicarbonate transport family permease [Planctomycetota bacterium]